MNKLVLILCLVTCRVAQPSKVIWFSLMVSEGLDLNTSSVLSAVEQEVTAVNSNTSILSGYKLQYTIHRHSECNSVDSISQFLNNVKSGEVILGLIGCGCSPATEEVAKISSFWNIPIISYASTSAVLSDRSVFRNFFRTVPSDELLPPLVASTMKYYNWTQLVVVTEITPQYLKVLSYLRNELKIRNLSLETTVEFTTDSDEEEFSVKAEKSMNVQSHIVFLNTQPKWALKFLCSAYHNKRLQPNYVWILHGLYNEKWWTAIDTMNCSKEQIIQALDRAITITVNPSQVEQSDTDLVSDYAVDAVRSLVLSLIQTISDVNDNSTASGLPCENIVGEIVPLEKFTYDNSLMSCLIMNNLQDINFTGRSGQVVFNEHGDRLLESSGIMKQFRRLGNESVLHEIKFAHVCNNSLDYFPNFNDSNVWPAGIPPDGTPVQVVDSIKPLFAVLVSIVSAVCITFSLLCCAFMLIFRNRKVVKLTSPNLNYLIVIGTILLSMAMILYSIPATSTLAVSVLCWGRLFCVSTGHDLCFAVALLKTWRVYYIFKSRSSKKQIPKDSLLLAVTMVIIAVDLFFYGVFLIPNQLTSSASIQPNLENLPTKNDKGVLQMFYFVDCPKSIYYYLFIIFSLGFKYILHIIAGIFAFSIRKVKVGSLNDFRYVSTYVYVSSILITMYIAFVFIGAGRPTLFTGALIGILFLEIALLLCLVFIPKMVHLYRDPNGDHIFDEAQKAMELSVVNTQKVVTITTNNV